MPRRHVVETAELPCVPQDSRARAEGVVIEEFHDFAETWCLREAGFELDATAGGQPARHER